MGLIIYHAALGNGLIIHFMNSRILPLHRQNVIEDFLKSSTLAESTNRDSPKTDCVTLTK